MAPNKRGGQVNRRHKAGNRLIILCEIAVIIVLVIIASCGVSATKSYVEGPQMLSQGEIEELLINKVPSMSMSFEPYSGELRGNLQLESGSIIKDNYSDSPYWNKNVLIEENGLIAQNEDWYFGPCDDENYYLCAINKQSGKKIILADFEAVNINYYNDSLYFTNVEYSLEDSFIDYDITANQKMGGRLFRIDRIDELNEKTNPDDIIVNEMGKPGYAYFKLDVNAGGIYTLIVNTETEDDRTGYVTLDENGEQAGVILAPAGENIVTYVEKDGYAYIEIMVEDEDLSEAGERYIICVDRDHGSGEITRINGTSLHYCCGQVIFQSTEDMYLYAVDDSYQNAYVISQYPVSTFTVFGDYIDAIAANRTHNSLRIGKVYTVNPFNYFCILDVNGWTNFISVTPKVVADNSDRDNNRIKKENNNSSNNNSSGDKSPDNDDWEKDKTGEKVNKPGDKTEDNQDVGTGMPNGNEENSTNDENAGNIDNSNDNNGNSNNGNNNENNGVGNKKAGGSEDLPIADIKPENYKDRDNNPGYREPLGELPKLFDDEPDKVGQSYGKENGNGKGNDSGNINISDDEPDGIDPTLVSIDGIIKAVDEYINYVKNNGSHISGEPKYSAKGSADFERKYFGGNTIREYMVDNLGMLEDVKKYKGDREKAERELKDGTADYMLDLYSGLSLSYEINQLSFNGRKAIVRFNQYNHLDLNGISEQAVRTLGQEFKNSGSYSITEWAEDDAMYRAKAALWMLPKLIKFEPCEYTFDVLVTYDDKNKVWSIANDADDYSIEQIFLPEMGMKFEGSIDTLSGKTSSSGSGDKTDLSEMALKMGKTPESNPNQSRLKAALNRLGAPRKRELVHKESAYKGNPYKKYIKFIAPEEYADSQMKNSGFDDNIRILVNEDREKIIDTAKNLIKNYEKDIKRLKKEGNSGGDIEYLRDKIECLEWAITKIKIAQGNNLTIFGEKAKEFWQRGQDFADIISETKSKQMIADEKDRDLKYKSRVAKQELLPAITEVMYYGRFGEKLTGHYDNWDYYKYYYEWK